MVHSLSGTWAHKLDGVTLQAYRMLFTCDQVGENFSGFVLLAEAKLDDEVACAEVDLFLIPNKLVNSSVSPCGQVYLDPDQVRKSKLFQEFFFNGISGKLFTGSKSSGVQKEFILKEENDILWSTSNMYLLLPIESSISLSLEPVVIDWRCIDSCASVVEYLRNRYSSDDEFFFGSLGCRGALLKTECEKSNIIHLANKFVYIDHLKDMIVFAIHTGKIYSVLEVEVNVSSEDPFDQFYDVKSSEYTTFADYFCKKYGIVLQHPRQPLLLLKQSHNPHNLLVPRSKYEGGSLGPDMMAEKAIIPAHMPPELLVHIDVSIDVVKSFYLLPSLMHRLESLLLASQLREEIACQPSGCQVSSFLILEAITSQRCCEDFSLERLELLGDSVLKYAVSCHLFFKHPQKHEGQLSAYRSWAVCNSTLHKLGTNCNLQVYIRDNPLDPRRWVASGQISMRPVPCDCGLDTLAVPLGSKYMTEKISVKVGKVCDRGHRWMCSKTIADCVEALIGAYYVSGGLSAAVELMRWFGIDAEIEPKLIKVAKMNASLWCYLPKAREIKTLESNLNYKFSVKGLLLEAITHPSQQELGIGYCYQRLEFLGDSVLDLLITWHLFQNHKDIDPGELTDLRSASVNNEKFAQASVRHNLQQHLLHGSGVLLGQITEYVNHILEFHDNMDLFLSLGNSKGPKERGISHAQYVAKGKKNEDS